jgi:hypothetical protein
MLEKGLWIVPVVFRLIVKHGIMFKGYRTPITGQVQDD